MKLCVVVPSFYPAFIYGGPIISIHNTCQALADQGVEVFVSTTNANGESKLNVPVNQFQQLAKNYNVKYYDDTIVGRFSWQFFFNIAADIKACDVVKVEDIFSTYVPITLFFSVFYKKKVMLSVRGVLSRWALNSRKKIFKQLWLFFFIRPFRNYIVWHATSLDEKDDINRSFPSSNVVVVPNGVNAEDYRKTPILSRSQYFSLFGISLPDDNQVIVSMGRLHKVKGFKVLIEAFSMLHNENPKIVLLIAGDDDGVGEELSLMIHRLGLINAVFLLGNLSGNKKIQFLAGADIFALTSYSENFGNVYLEALASGTPILATEGTPWRDIGRFGCGVSTDYTPDNIKNALRDMLAGDLVKMRESSFSYANNFTWNSIAAKIRVELEAIE